MWISRTFTNDPKGLKYIPNINNDVGLTRAYGGSIFSYNGYGYNFYVDSWQLTDSGWCGKGWIDKTYDAYYTKTWASRAVIVIGEDF